ncbi:DUF4391 domain-containing protein [Kangiella profundi]|uniref:DUF4391 domain-containing protein n=1 Tax=Kangiella profundi TaxID=1561924 RepID=A0A2K9AVP6_9GAMM|nr:DUF4391 domain-containing protein [Kangiella profundi]AUD79181.1 DUF4391 domain-containing protein [Kangiella profundi]GGF00799.1 hypothetical protein GCM10011356_13110 [Kangiella profundi]
MNSFQELLDYMAFPETTLLDKPLYKRMFLEHASLDAADKKALKETIDKIRWIYTLKPSTINIAAYSDDQYDYSEIAVLHVETHSVKQYERIGEFINRAIPYPLVVLMSTTVGNREYVNLCLADKRQSKSDKDKQVIEELYFSGWIELAVSYPGQSNQGQSNQKQSEPEQTEQESPNQDFLASLKVSALPFTDFRRFYQAMIDRVVALNWAAKTGNFVLLTSQERSLEKRKALKQYHELELKIQKLRKELKQSAFNRQVELNATIKKYQQELKRLEQSLS